MGKTKELKTRIKSVKSTHQITNAMNIVSSTKFKRFSKLVEDSKPYSDGIGKILSNVASAVKHLKHPLFDGKESVKKIGVIVMASDRGLCGSFNSSTFKALEKLIKENPDKDVSVIALGKKTRDYCKKRDINVKAEYIQLVPEVMFEKAKEIAENALEFYAEDIFDEVHMISTEFISAVSWEIKTKKVLPIQRKEEAETDERKAPYIFEPSEEAILGTLLPKSLNIDIYQSLLENTASEHAARRQAMQNATDNAEDMISDLTLRYNRERQSAITQEITEIVSGANAQK